jgi:putative oxidoreductase
MIMPQAQELQVLPAATVQNSPTPVSLSQPKASVLKLLCDIAGRVLLSTVFLLEGLDKIGNYAGTVAFMSSLGVPGALLPIVIVTEVAGALSIILGWKTRITAFLLAGYCLLTGLIFHHHFADQIQMIMFLKNVSIAGGFLLLLANGAGPLSLDRRFST